MSSVRRMKALFEGLRSRETRRRVLATLGFLLLFRFGFQVPAPGMSPEFLRGGRHVTPTLGWLGLLSGSTLGSTTVLALGLLPYLGGCAIAWVAGRRRWKAPAVIAVGASTVFLVYGKAWTDSPEIFDASFRSNPAVFFPIATLSLLAGSALAAWIARRIDEVGVGYGIPILLGSGVIARLPHALVFLSGTEDGISAGLLLLPGLILSAWWIALTVLAARWRRRHPTPGPLA